MADFLIIDENKKWVDNKNVHNKKQVEDKDFSDKINDLVLSLQKVKTKEKVIFIDFCLLWRMPEWAW